MDIDQGCVIGQKDIWICNHKLFWITALLTTIAFTIIIMPSITILSPFISTMRHTSSPISLPLQPAYGQRVPQGAGCNCIIDDTSSGHFNNNITGLTIPKVNLLKNQTLPSHTGEGRSNSVTARSTQLMGIVTKDFFLGNFTGGPGATVALNTINVKPNESLGVQIYGGNIPRPTVVKGEIISANVNANETLAKIKLVGSKISQFQLLFTKAIKKPVLGINRFLVNVKAPGYYLLLMSLGYNSKSNNNNLATTNTSITDKFLGSQQTRYPLITIYETILRIG